MEHRSELDYQVEIFNIATKYAKDSEAEAFAILDAANRYCEDIFFIANEVEKKRLLINELTSKLNNKQQQKGDRQ